jgi:putative inorganic carbon (hco3(-)) transporter
MEVTNPMNSTKSVPSYLFAGLLLFFILEYVRPGSYIPVLEAAKLNAIIPLSVFILTFLSGGGPTNSEILKMSNMKWFSFFLCLFPIQFFTADVTQYVFDIFKAVLGYILIYFVIIKQVNTIWRMKAVLIILISVHLVLVILNPSLILQPEQRNYIMGVPFLGDGNDFAWSACIAVPFAIFLAFSSTNKLTKIAWWAITCVLMLTVVGTQSRGGNIALGAVLLYLFIMTKRKIVGVIGLMVVGIVMIMFAPQVYFDRMASVMDYETEGSAQGRIMAWKSAVRMAVDHPLIGVGAGHFGVKYGVEYRPPGVGRTEIPWANAHSIYFMMLGEFGLTGVFLLLGLIIANILRNRRRIRGLDNADPSEQPMKRNLLVTIQASFIGYAVGGAFLSGYYYPHLFILAALCDVTNRKTSGVSRYFSDTKAL